MEAPQAGPVWGDVWENCEDGGGGEGSGDKDGLGFRPAAIAWGPGDVGRKHMFTVQIRCRVSRGHAGLR